jgi:3-dehydroquinate synthase
MNALQAQGHKAVCAVIPAGESSKCEEQLFLLYNQALDAALDRSSCVVALGGGVVGDVAGYLAASFMRGIPFVQVPTSLLAMVDSAVGGKTGINLPRGKNLVGAFHQPALVLADLQTLRTLPQREYISGLAEVIKYGMIADKNFFCRIEAQAERLLNMEESVLAEVVRRCCEIKADVVRQDERETGLRAILNYGHTLGHAVERVTDYRQYLHGEAVAIGMAYAARLSVELTGLNPEVCRRLITLLQTLGLPVSADGLPWADLRKAMQHDKKTRHNTLKFVLTPSCGQARAGCEMPEEMLEKVWAHMAP